VCLHNIHLIFMGQACGVGSTEIPKAKQIKEVNAFQRYKIAHAFNLWDRNQDAKLNATDFAVWGSEVAKRNKVKFTADLKQIWVDAFNKCFNPQDMRNLSMQQFVDTYSEWMLQEGSYEKCCRTNDNKTLFFASMDANENGEASLKD